MENVSPGADYLETKAAEQTTEAGTTVEDLLTMRTGQNWIEYADPNLRILDQMLVPELARIFYGRFHGFKTGNYV